MAEMRQGATRRSLGDSGIRESFLKGRKRTALAIGSFFASLFLLAGFQLIFNICMERSVGGLDMPIIVFASMLVSIFVLYAIERETRYKRNLEVIEDRLEREKIEREKVEESQKEQVEKMKVFAYSIVHDLKSPAIAIYGLTRLLEKQYTGSLDERGKDYCRKIKKASESVGELVEKINNYISAKQMPIEIERIDLGRLLNDIMEEFRERLEERQVVLKMPENTIRLEADRIALMRIFRNLIENSLKYGGEQLKKIRIEYNEQEDFHIFHVADDGQGLMKCDTHEIFECFERGISDGSIEGTGLGLAIVKEMVVRHRGKVVADTEMNKGARFTFSISKGLRRGEG